MNDTVRSAVREMMERGMGRDEIAAQMHISKQQAAQYMTQKTKSTKRTRIEELLKEGRGTAEVARMTGASETWVHKCMMELVRAGVEVRPPEERKRIWLMSDQVRWVRYVNVIRKYCGMELMPEPKFEEG